MYLVVWWLVAWAVGSYRYQTEPDFRRRVDAQLEADDLERAAIRRLGKPRRGEG